MRAAGVAGVHLGVGSLQPASLSPHSDEQLIIREPTDKCHKIIETCIYKRTD